MAFMWWLVYLWVEIVGFSFFLLKFYFGGFGGNFLVFINLGILEFMSVLFEFYFKL